MRNLLVSAFALGTVACSNEHEDQRWREQREVVNRLDEKLSRIGKAVDRLEAQQVATSSQISDLKKDVASKPVAPPPPPSKTPSAERQKMIAAYKNLDAYAAREGWSFERTEGVRKVLDERLQRLNAIEGL